MKLFLGFLKMSYVFKHGDSSINYFWDRAHNIFKAKLNKMMKDLIHNNKSDIKTLLFYKRLLVKVWLIQNSWKFTNDYRSRRRLESLKINNSAWHDGSIFYK
jgi:hypothetical protein